MRACCVFLPEKPIDDRFMTIPLRRVRAAVTRNRLLATCRRRATGSGDGVRTVGGGGEAACSEHVEVGRGDGGLFEALGDAGDESTPPMRLFEVEPLSSGAAQVVRARAVSDNAHLERR